MPQGYRIRVELHDADSTDYETLHDAMKAVGIGRNITSNKGVVYRLPPGEYYVFSESTLDEIYDAAAAAATTTDLAFEIIVSEAGQSKWWGMKQVLPKITRRKTG